MTQVRTVVDSNVPLLMDDDAANPYNRKKPWHKQNSNSPQQSAESLFFEKDAPTKEGNKEPQGQSDADEKEVLEKRWKNLKKTHDTKQEEWKELVANLQKEIDTLKVTPKIPQNIEDLERLKQQDPELYSKVETIARQIVQTDTSEVKNQLDDINKREYELAKKEARKELLKAHPDVYDIVATEDFDNWKTIQPQEIKDWIEKNPNSTLAIRAIDLYKIDTGYKKESKRNSKTISDDDASSLISTRSTQVPADSTKKIWTRAEINRLSMDDYDKYEAEIDQAIREGRIK
jgi:hypothetical protein